LYIHAKNLQLMGCFGSLQGIKIHFREFLYGFMRKRNKLLAGALSRKEPPRTIPTEKETLEPLGASATNS
jgi:hypothetical protein